MQDRLLTSYSFARQIVCDEGYAGEIAWQSKACVTDIDESTLLRELAWVILTAGFRESVIRGIFSQLTLCFCKWQSAAEVVSNAETCYTAGMAGFSNHKKINAIIDCARLIDERGFETIMMEFSESPIDTLRQFPFIGPVTVYHLAKNLGVSVAKPDRHLVRIAESMGFKDVQEFCKAVSNISGDEVPVVDIVFWRFATIEPNYESILNCVKAE